MSIREDLAIDWSASPRIIEVAAPSIELTIQDLYDTVRSLAASEGIDEPEIIDGSGKEVLSETEKVGLTVKLFNAKVKFEDRSEPTDCDIYGGNLVAIDVNGYPMNPIQYATYIIVTYAKSSSATMVQNIVIDLIKSIVDSIKLDTGELEVQVGEAQYQIAGVQETVDEQPAVLSEQHGSGSWEKAVLFKEE